MKRKGQGKRHKSPHLGTAEPLRDNKFGRQGCGWWLGGRGGRGTEKKEAGGRKM
jgi:hypothetical protein